MPDEREETPKDRLAEMAEEAEGILAPSERRFELPEPPSQEEIDARLGRTTDQMEALADRVTQPGGPQGSGTQIELGTPAAGNRSSMAGLALGLHLASTIVGVPLAFLAVGWVLDLALGTEILKGLLVLVGATVGIVLALRTMSGTNPRR